MLQKAASEAAPPASVLMVSTSSHQPSCPGHLCQSGTRLCPEDRLRCEALFNLSMFGGVRLSSCWCALPQKKLEAMPAVGFLDGRSHWERQQQGPLRQQPTVSPGRELPATC